MCNYHGCDFEGRNAICVRHYRMVICHFCRDYFTIWHDDHPALTLCWLSYDGDTIFTPDVDAVVARATQMTIAAAHEPNEFWDKVRVLQEALPQPIWEAILEWE